MRSIFAVEIRNDQRERTQTHTIAYNRCFEAIRDGMRRDAIKSLKMAKWVEKEEKSIWWYLMWWESAELQHRQARTANTQQ